MKGYIYISGVFETVNRPGGGVDEDDWRDNDPHFWSQPPTWGICRTDLRHRVKRGDYVFFVLPKTSRLPQMVYGYFRVAERITHEEAYHRPELRCKRMGNENPNGNIIVDKKGNYNKLDKNVHKDSFHEIKGHYIIGDPKESAFLKPKRIKELAPTFVDVLNDIFGKEADTAFGVLTQKGRRMSEEQVYRLRAWLR